MVAQIFNVYALRMAAVFLVSVYILVTHLAGGRPAAGDDPRMAHKEVEV
jgi:hypothetical protein